MDFLSETAALQPNVSAYRKSHSTATTLLAIRDDILKVRVRVRSLLYTPPRGSSVMQDKTIIHYQVYTKKYLPKKKFPFLKFLLYNKKLKSIKRSRDQEIYVTMFASVSV